ncbi:hypothetical protein Adt_30451 [Abeliophyllum distichum]|uniref:Transmembrane protein n=1 Tax=Abeliophyllum distichum TaxID=126358 RepID=A0ABD1RBB9_9LAMI
MSCKHPQNPPTPSAFSEQTLKSPPMDLLLLVTILSLLSTTRAKDRVHGLSHESPMAISPEAYSFFNPDTQQPNPNISCDSSDCSSLPMAATVESTPEHESVSTGGIQLGAGGIAGIPFAFVFACLIAMGIYYVVIKRQSNLRRATPDQLPQV